MIGNDRGYLFAYFIGEKEDEEQVYFSISEDGLHWKDLNEGKPILVSETGELGVRDPFLFRSKIDQKYYIIATDLRIASGKGWGVAQFEGSTSIIIWESVDLVHWSKERAVMVAPPGAGCVWAPETIYDAKRDEYLVFWASMVKEEYETEVKQRIYCATTRDFIHFSETWKYIERDNHIIDTTIILQNGIYYRISKDETTKNIRIDRGEDLQKGPFTPMDAPTLELLKGVEGPAAFCFHTSETWCLMVDQYATGGGYLPLISEDLEHGKFRILDETEFDMDKNKKRHGSVLGLKDFEYQTLVDYYM